MDDHGSNLQTRAGDEEEMLPGRSYGPGPAGEAQAEVPNARRQRYQRNQQVYIQTSKITSRVFLDNTRTWRSVDN